jgi:ornithine cyclodeaminase/alanine dehydrogenase-like protein (mu-crystallin family)
MPSGLSRDGDGLRSLSADEVHALLSVQEAADALERGFLARDAQQLEGIPRTVLDVPDRTDPAEMLLMPAFGFEGAGLKLVSIVRGNQQRGLPLIQGVYVLLSQDAMTPELLVDGAALTGLRTSAVSALATRHLARPDSRRLVVFGAGAQAAAHIQAMRAILPIEQVTVVGSAPDSPRAVTLVERLRATGVDAATDGPQAVAGADVVCTCTTSTTPVFDDGDLPAGVHVNAVGAYRLDMAELPADTLARALLVVESLEAARVEAGDVVAAIDAGALPPDAFAHSLSDVLSGTVSRSADDQITVFKSVGLPTEDLIIARALADALQNARL